MANDSCSLNGYTFKHPPKPAKVSWMPQLVRHQLADGSMAVYNKGFILKGTLEWGSNGWIDADDYSNVAVMYNQLTATCTFNPRDIKYPPNLLRNGNVEIWTNGAAAAPDGWVLSGGGSIARESGTIKIGTYSTALTSDADGNNVYQIFGADKGNAYWNGKTVTFSAWVYADDASTARLQLWSSAGGNTYSSYHTGDSSWQLLTVTHTFSGVGPVYAFFYVDTNTKVAYIDGAIVAEGSLATLQWHGKDFNVQIVNDFNFIPHGGDLQNGRQLYAGVIEFQSSVGEITATAATIF